MAKILIADDDSAIRDMLAEIISDLGHESAQAGTAAAAIAAATQEPGFDLVLLDLRFPDCHDLSTLRTIRGKAPDTDVLIVTAETDDLALVREAVGCGIYDYIAKPLREDDIAIRVTRALEARRMAKTCKRAVDELASGREVSDIIGQSPAIQSVISQIKQIGAHELPVLVLGETGTGKELVARALHYLSPRRDKPFVSVNCAAIPQTLMESELFGHERGSFTGAVNKRQGAFARAEDGTIFLDEIGDISLDGQASLLRVLEQGEYDTVGGKTVRNRARVVLATNQDLKTLIESGQFRKDLFYRIDRLRIALPSLRDRKDDIPLLATYFLGQLNQKVGRQIKAIPENIMNALVNYYWPGNIRELRNELERLYIMSSGDELNAVNLSPQILDAGVQTGEMAASPESLAELEKLLEALKTCNGNVSQAAKMLKVHRNTVHRWMRRYCLLNPDGE